jgi:hypothetical protein
MLGITAATISSHFRLWLCSTLRAPSGTFQNQGSGTFPNDESTTIR